MALRIPIVAVVGRPNVGKSTFFNRVCGKRLAVVEDTPGVTRDRNYALIESYEFPFYLVDTGGFEKASDDEMQMLVSEQAVLAAEEADVVVAMFDGQTGRHPGDDDVVALLRTQSKPVQFVVNKCDGKEQEALAADFYSLGVDNLAHLSALHGRGMQRGIEQILQQLPNYQALCDSAKARRKLEEEAAQDAKAAEEQAAYVEKQEAKAEAASARAARRQLAAGNLAVQATPASLPTEEDASVPPGEEAVPPSFAPVFEPGDSEATADEYIRENRLLSLDESLSNEQPLFDDSEEPEAGEAEVEPEIHINSIRVALIGRPNVGKSTMLNTLTGEQRAITSPVAGTTRDALDLAITREGQEFVIIDTAGLRRKARIGDRIEHYSTMRSLRAISDCDVAVVLLDAEQGPTEQDAKIVGLAHEQGRGIVIVVNKWDLVEKNHRSVQEFKEKIQQAFKFSPYAPIVFVSALSGKRCPKVIETVKRVAYSRAKKVPTVKLNKVLEMAMRRRTPPVIRGRPVKLYYATQVEVGPPRIVLFFNYPQSVHFSYLRFLKNSIRDAFGFEGTDIKLVCRKRGQTPVK